MLSNKQKVLIEKWEGLDRILFGSSSPQEILKENYEEYLATKACLLSEVASIYKVLHLRPALYNDDNILNESIKESLNMTTHLIKESPEFKEQIIDKMNYYIESGISEENSKYGAITETNLSITLDNFLMAIPVLETINVTGQDLQYNEKTIENLRESYKQFRDYIIKFANV